jgi:hypothetical protein
MRGVLRVIRLRQGASVMLAGVMVWGALAWRENVLVSRWVEHCVNQFRPKYQEAERSKCEAEAEVWRSGDEKPIEWAEYDAMMDDHFELLDSLPECVESDRALERCNAAARTAMGE